ncbi:MAG: hypothetical protein KC635_04345 [Myxococcales bacterium]|nr:hypothetical protein [Myxococcales bacterium]
MRHAALLLALAALAAACAPQTIIRRTAFVPAANAPARAGRPLGPGEVRLDGHANALNPVILENGAPDEGDAGVLVPDVHLGGSAWVGLPFGFELGAQAYWATARWAKSSADGVILFPRGEEPDLVMAGPGLRWNAPTGGSRFSVALMAEIDRVTATQAVFVCRDAEVCDGRAEDGDSARELYELDHVAERGFWLANAALQLGVAIVEPVYLYTTVGAQQSISNSGFDPRLDSRLADAMHTYWLGTWGIGADFRVDSLVFGVSFYFPFAGEDDIGLGPAASFKLGVVFGGERPRLAPPRAPRWADPR